MPEQRITKPLSLRFGMLLALAAVMLLTGCGGDKLNTNGTPTDDTSPSGEHTPSGDGQAIDPPRFIAPLTGMQQEQEANLRPIAVMVNNLSAARPQSGLPDADVIWEVLAEGGITRLVAIFQSTSSTAAIGPFRSNRPYLIRIGEAYHAVLAHAGASTDAYDLLQHHGKEYLDEISNAGAYFYRESFRKPPHNLYSNLEKLRAGAAKKKYPEKVDIPAYTWSDAGATASGEEAAKVDIHFLLKNYKVSYAYDPAAKLYKRSINDKPHTDLQTKAQLTATNLVILGAKHRTYDDYGRLEIDLESGGPAILAELGRAVQCEWVRSADGMIRLMKDGQELPFVPGRTFFHIVPMTPTFEGHVNLGAATP